MMVTKAKPHGVGRQTSKNPMVVEGMAGGIKNEDRRNRQFVTKPEHMQREREREKERISKLILTVRILALSVSNHNLISECATTSPPEHRYACVSAYVPVDGNAGGIV